MAPDRWSASRAVELLRAADAPTRICGALILGARGVAVGVGVGLLLIALVVIADALR